jgi:hypothetical protein
MTEKSGTAGQSPNATCNDGERQMLRNFLPGFAAAVIAMMAGLAPASAADSTSYHPVDLTWQKPWARQADTATNAMNATNATNAATANALCPTCTISGSQVSGAVGSAGYATNSGYAASAGTASSADYANNAGYAYSAAGSAALSCPALSAYQPAAPNGTASGNGGGNNTYICVDGTWAFLPGVIYNPASN